MIETPEEEKQVVQPCAQFTGDVNLKDGSKVLCGAIEMKKWTLTNNGLVAWPSSTCVVALGPNADSWTGVYELPTNVRPLVCAEVSVTVRIPEQGGAFRVDFSLANESGELFGPRFWLDVVAVAPEAAPVPVALPVKVAEPKPVSIPVALPVVAQEPMAEEPAVVEEKVASMEDVVQQISEAADSWSSRISATLETWRKSREDEVEADAAQAAQAEDDAAVRDAQLKAEAAELVVASKAATEARAAVNAAFWAEEEAKEAELEKTRAAERAEYEARLAEEARQQKEVDEARQQQEAEDARAAQEAGLWSQMLASLSPEVVPAPVVMPAAVPALHKYEEQLTMIAEMGFGPREVIEVLLEENRGNLQRVVAYLLQQQ